MKRRLIAAIVAFLIVAAPAFLIAFQPEDWMSYSATKTASAQIDAGAGYFYGIIVKTDATNSVTFQVFDSLTAAGTRIGPDYLCTTSSTNRMCAFGFDPPVSYNTGLYVKATSTDASPDFTVFYRSQ